VGSANRQPVGPTVRASGLGRIGAGTGLTPCQPHLRRDSARLTSAHIVGSPPGRPRCARRYVRAADAAVVAVDVRGAQLLSLLQALLNAPPHGLQVGEYGRIIVIKGKGLLGIRVWAFRNKGIRAKGFAAGEGGGRA
jgi:hypothetical protein